MSDDNISWVAYSFWTRAQEVTNRDLDAGYRVDMVERMRNTRYSAGYVAQYARRWADNMEDAVNGEFEAQYA